MQCPRCQQENPAGVKFCGECGARFDAMCRACSAANPPGNKFCHECGEAIVAGAPPAKPASPPPESYLPRHLAERIISSRGALEGERKQVTVLFADLKGSMELLADRDPEDARRILDPVLEHMMDAVHRYEGTVNQVMGDGIMALFGAPLAHEDHAIRACYAALRMQEAVTRYAAEVRRSEGAVIQTRVGINSGEVIVRSIGSDLRMDYTAVGQTTHLAARMEQLATPGSILLAPATLQLAEGYVQVQTLGPMTVKGLNEPIEVYELTGVGAARSRLQAAAARGLTKFVGRDTELDTLRRTSEQAGAGHGQVVALVGEPGVGKSRLVWEFSHSHRTQDWLVLESGSVSYGTATAYLPVIDLVKSYCGIEARDDPRRVRQKLLGKVLDLDRTLEPIVPALLGLLDVSVDDAAWQALDPPQRRQRTLDALKRLLLRESQEQPLLLVFEDLHWIDMETQALLDSLVDSLPTTRVLLLVNYRPEYEHGWHRKTYYRELRLDPLPPESAEDLLQALLGGDESLASLKRLLIQRTEGNPFFLEESVRELAETGALAAERGAYRVVQPLASTQVPATVQAVLAARIDRLAPEDKRVLQSAAVIGKDVLYPLLQAIAERPEQDLREGLVRLQAAEFLYETSLFPDVEYTFKHALTYEVAYGSLLQERRRTLHVQIVDAIERLYSDRLAEYVERLAHHALRGESWTQAVAYLRQAAARAVARSASWEVVAYLEQALQAVGQLPLGRETSEQAVDVRVELRNALVPLAEYERIRNGLREAETLAAALADQRRLGRVQAYLTNYYWITGDHNRAVEVGERALAIATRHADLALEVQTNHALNQAYHALGVYRRAAQLDRRNIELLAGDRLLERCGQPHFPSVIARVWLASCLTELGELAEASEYSEEAIRIAEAVDQPFSLTAAYLAASGPHICRGDVVRAIPLVERALEICRGQGVPILIPQVMGQLGYAEALAGRGGDACSRLEKGLEQEAAMRLSAFSGRLLVWLGEAYLLAGRTGDASQTAGRALAYAQAHHERGHEAWALRLLAEVVAQPIVPDVEQAERYFQQAVTLSDELGMRPLVARCHLGLGTLYHKAGRHNQAQTELALAAEQYRAMDMTLWLANAEAALAEVAH